MKQLKGFQKEYYDLLKKHGRTAQWLVKSWGKYNAPAFYVLMSVNRFTPDEQQQIKSLIIEGDKSEYYHNSK